MNSTMIAPACRSARRAPWATMLAAASAVAMALVPAGSRAASGSDQFTGYEWFDSASGALAGPGFFGGPVTTTSPVDNSSPVAVTLPWNFPFYGLSTNTVWLSDNGWLSLVDPAGNAHPTPGTLPSLGVPNATIARFWTDLNSSSAATGQSIRHGVSAGSSYRIQQTGVQQPSGQQIQIDSYLYSDGRIKLQFQSGAIPVGATIGIENETGTDGFSVVNQGVPAPGVPGSYPGGYVIDILPPPILAAECANLPALACGRLNARLPGGLPNNITTYGCSPGVVHGANEHAFALTLTDPSRVQLDLTPGTATNLRMYLLQTCSERSCLRGPAATMDLLLAPGTYYVVVDALATVDEGTFTLDTTCTPIGVPLTCGDTVSDDTTGGSTLYTSYPCAGPFTLTGPEDMYAVTLATGTNLRATLTGTTADLDVLIFALPPAGEITSSSCVLRGDDSAVLWGAAAGEYLIVVDGVNGAAGSYTLETECAVNMDCSTVAGTIDLTAVTIQNVSGDTTAGQPNVSAYLCDPSLVFDGNELIYEIVMPDPGQIAVYQPGLVTGHSFFILRDCNEGSCVGTASGACGTNLPAGNHYLVVDSARGNEGPFFAQLVYEPFFNRWSECQDPRAGTQLSDTVRTVWGFDDHDYCYTDPGSRNFPNGCTFAMYVTARCGTEFHIPLQDVESGHVRIYDVFRQEYMLLEAESTGGWTLTGTDISWEDCPGTNNTIGNNQTIDISFSRPDGLCGLYRLEFPLHSGFIWDLYANCTGTNTAGFQIFDSLCGALEVFEPLPDVNLTDATIVLNCPDVEVTYTVENNGCGTATDVVVSLFDNVDEVAVDVIPQIAPGATYTATFTASFPAGFSTTNVTLQVDAGDRVQECEDVPGAGCALTPSQNLLVLTDCGPNCDITPGAFTTPATACEGDPLDINASGSTSIGCPGDLLEYQLTGPGGTLSWQADPVFSGLTPGQTTDYTLEVRCADPSLSATCIGSIIVPAIVERRPLFDGASVVATEVDCEMGIDLSWSGATFFGPTSTGAYNIYRSTVSCADATSLVSPTGGRIGTAVGTAFLDVTTNIGETYYYVVEAEDETAFPGGCVPSGPQFGGAVTRVSVQGGTCAGILERNGPDPALLPVIGPSLRLGWPDPHSETSVTMRWTTSAPIDVAGGEHFHVLRSDLPAFGFVQINLPDPPLLQVPTYTDANATQPGVGTQVYFYLAFVSNLCHADNRVQDPSASP